MASSLEEVRPLAAADSVLAVAVTVRPDGTPHASVVSAAVLPHPVDGEPSVGFVVAAGAVKPLQILIWTEWNGRGSPEGTDPPG